MKPIEPFDTIRIKNIEELKAFGVKIKEKAASQEDQKVYSSNGKDFDDFLDNFAKEVGMDENPKEKIKQIIKNGLESRKHIIYRGWLLNIIATKSDLGRRFHISLSGFDVLKGPSDLTPIPQALAKEVLDAIFGNNWQEIKSPSKQTYVTHYIAD